MQRVNTFDIQELEKRVHDGMSAPFGPNNLPKYVDCGDDRELTDAVSQTRDDLPARYFGGASGLAISALSYVILSSESGSKLVKGWINEYEHGLADLAADITNTLYKERGIVVHQHSCTTKEPTANFISPNINDDLGCAFNAKLGIVLGMANGVSETGRGIVSDYYGESSASYINNTIGGINEVRMILGGSRAKVSRQALIRVLQDDTRKTPTALVEGEHCAPDQAKLIMDLAGYKARAFGKEYQHSVTLPELLLPSALPEFNFSDQRLLEVSSVIIGLSTQKALGVENTLVIPQQAQV